METVVDYIKYCPMKNSDTHKFGITKLQNEKIRSECDAPAKLQFVHVSPHWQYNTR